MRCRITWVVIGVLLGFSGGFWLGSQGALSRERGPGLPMTPEHDGHRPVPPTDAVREPGRAAAGPSVPSDDIVRSHGTTETLEAVPWDRACELVGRLLDESGEVAASTGIRFQLRYGVHVWGEWLSTDEDGVFRYTMHGAAPDTDGLMVIQPGYPPNRTFEWYIPPAVEAIRELPRRLPVGELSMGDVRLEEKPVVVRGTLFTPEGDGISAQLKIDTFVAGQELPTWWSITSAEDGAFVLPMGRYDTEGPTVRARVSVEVPGYASIVELPFSPGAELLLRLSPGRSVTGSVRVHELTFPEIAITGSDGAERECHGGRYDEGRYEWTIDG
ncbi:MAG: hypothetical protein KDC38_03940, partial [Planctomycetes bacterium]|nr:hypothetical protein [Planctomycetota bacterium]